MKINSIQTRFFAVLPLFNLRCLTCLVGRAGGFSVHAGVFALAGLFRLLGRSLPSFVLSPIGPQTFRVLNFSVVAIVNDLPAPVPRRVEQSNPPPLHFL